MNWLLLSSLKGKEGPSSVLGGLTYDNTLLMPPQVQIMSKVTDQIALGRVSLLSLHFTICKMG